MIDETTDPLDMQQNDQEDNIVDEKFTYAKLSRRDIRSVMFHLLYALESNDYNVSIDSVVDDFNRGFDLDIPLDSEPAQVVEKIALVRTQLDSIIQRFLVNWRLERLGVCTKLVLYLGIWELLTLDTPSTIVINEAVELAKGFSELDAYKFVNGVLDEASKRIEELKPEIQ
ncbi:MAG: transcription antitermination factor NusB [Candidatus Babeliales bacterium]|nr:transcription antitermination factor NusB [Candidatus Babeliales bacterium]